MQKKSTALFIIIAVLALAACGATVGGSMGPEEDSAVPDSQTRDSATADNDAADASPAAVIVDRQFEAPSLTVSTWTGRVTFLSIYALNDGDQTGTLDRMVFDARSIVFTASGEQRPAGIRDAVRACYAVRDGTVVATARLTGESIVFDHAGIAITTHHGVTIDDFVHFVVACDVQVNGDIIPLNGALRIWLSANWATGFTLVEPPPAGVQGTLDLSDNGPAAGDFSMYVQFVR